MKPERIKSVLQQIADRTPRSDLHGQSLKGLKKRGLVRAQYSTGPDGELRVAHYLTKAGRELLAAGQGARD